MVLENDPHAVALVDLNRWARAGSVVAPDFHVASRHQPSLDRLGDQVELLRSRPPGAREVRNVRGFHGHDPTAAALASVSHALHVHARSARLRGCK